MRIAVIQSSFVPWRGYFDFIASVDLFVFYDDVQYSKGGWRNRNMIKTPSGAEWVTVPLKRSGLDSRVNEVKVDYSHNWIKKLIGSMSANYGRAAFFTIALELLREIEATRYEKLTTLNIELIKRICSYLHISTPFLNSAELSLVGTKTDRLINLLETLDATTYLSGPTADVYLDKEAFRRHSIRLEYKSYDYAPYPQLWGPFAGSVSILDLIANCGPDSISHIRSRTPDRIMVE